MQGITPTVMVTDCLQFSDSLQNSSRYYTLYLLWHIFYHWWDVIRASHGPDFPGHGAAASAPV